MIRTGLIVLVMTMGLTVASHAQTAEKYHKISDSYVALASQTLNSGNAAEAQALYEKALVANPSSVKALVGLGKAHTAQGRSGRGLKYYRFALEVTPNNKPALVEQSLAFLKKGNIDRATSNQLILERLCSDGCAELSSVNAAIDDFRAHPPEVKNLEDKAKDKEPEG